MTKSDIFAMVRSSFIVAALTFATLVISSKVFGSCDGSIYLNGVRFEMEGFRHAPSLEVKQPHIIKHIMPKPAAEPQVPAVKPKVDTIPFLVPVPPSLAVTVWLAIKANFINMVIILLVLNEIGAAIRTYRRNRTKQAITQLKRLREAISIDQKLKKHAEEPRKKPNKLHEKTKRKKK